MGIVPKRILALLLLLNSQAAVLADESLTKGIELYNRKRFVEALQIFSNLKSTENESKRFYYCALCYLQMGQTDKARDLFQRIEANFKGSEAAQLAHAFLVHSNPKIDSPSTYAGASLAAGSFAASAAADPTEFSIPFRRTSKGQMAVQADLQGRRMEMIFDTGAEECLFGRNQVETANLSDADRERMPPLNTVSGPVPVYKVTASIRLGSLRRTLPIMVQDAVMDTPILGQPFFNGYDCSVDGQAALMRFHKSGSARGNFLVDSFAVPFVADGDKMIVTTRFNGRNVDMCFDSGAFGVCLSKEQAERLRIRIGDTPPTNTKGPNGSYVNSWDMFADITLGDIRKEHFPIRVIDCTTSYPLLGLNFFGDRIYKIDREKKEIRFAR